MSYLNDDRVEISSLLQRVLLNELPHENHKGVDRHFIFDYMGSSEYEWGALPDALRSMRDQKHASISEVEIMKDGNTIKLFAVCYGDTPEERMKSAKSVAATAEVACMNDPRDRRFKEAPHMREAFGLAEMRGDPPVGWWAIDVDPSWVAFVWKHHAERWLKCTHG